MKRKRKPPRVKSLRHLAARRRGIVSTPLRLAFDALQEPIFNEHWHWVVPTIPRIVAKLTGGRASRFLVRHWCNGTRRAPAWFVAVLVGELEKQIRHRQDILRQLAEYQPQDRERRSREQARLAREIIARGHGAIGKRIAAKRAAEAARDAELRALWLQRDRETLMGGLPTASAEPENQVACTVDLENDNKT